MSSDSNVFLILFRLDLSDPSPLGGSSSENLFPRMDDHKKYALLAGLLDPSLQGTRAPLTPICFSDEERQRKWQKCYNRILDRFEALIEDFYGDSGFVLHPDQFVRERQEKVGDRIERIGEDVYNLIPRSTPLWKWIDRIFEPAELGGRPKRPEDKHVTIITNDFSIPWYWMKGTTTPLLCEACSLGMLQLTTKNVIGLGSDESQPSRLHAGESLRALLINGTDGPDLPFIEEELHDLSEFMQQGQHRRLPLRPFKTDVVRDPESVERIWRYSPSERRRLYRLIHYSGHWNYKAKDLIVGDRLLDIDEIKEYLDSSVLALDGCSSSRGLQAWSDIENLTSKLLNSGALGCVITALPVKNDPIVSKVFCEALYGALLADTSNLPTLGQSGGESRNAPTLGQALVKARDVLKRYFKKTGSANPAWAFYQLIGNPSARLIEESQSNSE